MSLPPELWRRIATGLSSTWASTDWEVVTAEVLRRAEVCKKRQARATQMTQERSADIRDRVIDALGELPLSQDTEWLVKEVLNRMRCNPGVYGRAPSYRVARKNILELQQKAGVSIL